MNCDPHYVHADGLKIEVLTTDPNFKQFLRCDGCSTILYPNVIKHKVPMTAEDRIRAVLSYLDSQEDFGDEVDTWDIREILLD